MRWKLVAGLLLVASRVFAQPALYPGTNTNFVTGQGASGAITRWTSQGVIQAGSLTDSAVQANKSVCFADGTTARPMLNCGDAGIKYTKGSSPTLNLGVNGQYQINGMNVLGGGSFLLQERTAPSGVPGYDVLWADSTAHHLKMNNNNTGAVFVLGAATQGSATTVLHGGTPAFAAVSLTADVTGVLPAANGGTAQNSTATFPTSGIVATRITGTASETPGSLTAAQCADQVATVTLTGAVAGDSCSAGTPAAGPGTHIVASCYVSAADTATVRLCNVNSGSQTGTTGTYRATVIH